MSEMTGVVEEKGRMDGMGRLEGCCGGKGDLISRRVRGKEGAVRTYVRTRSRVCSWSENNPALDDVLSFD